jgi:hypothetical protein
MSNNLKKEILEEELKEALKHREKLAIRQRFFQNKYSSDKNHKQQNESNLMQVTNAQKEQEEWIEFLEQQLK